ncbi:peptidase S8/S53 domain-containing protein [Radiomyces spectabilis]|uniref:peptidase S8/S53 domain-containing protein n=1 Tax=Radiomyces spectabilis TaxID=64574 RepID=UPI00221F893A|nr:peptidase S8/S53 domain-containing protein [Radiomyces spectabilis]KAI8374361.1 peptidase S8/S53 domain-containing protein [Radiomyces spectabilis]
MRHSNILVLVVLTIATLLVGASNVVKRDTARQYYVLRFPSSRSNDNSDVAAAKDIATHLQVQYEGPVGELRNYFLVSTPIQTNNSSKRSLENDDDIVAAFHGHKKARRFNKRDDAWMRVQSIEKQVPRQRIKRSVIPLEARAPVKSQGQLLLEETRKQLHIKDPGFSQQWHLINQEYAGKDINVTGVWSQGITGNGSVVAILDDGLDFENDDLKDNFYAPGSYDFNLHVDLPKPMLWDDNHGTRCAGQIAAVKNDVCGIGIAYDAKVAGIRILSGEITDVDEAAALNYKYQENDIYSCSWGPPDNGETMEAPVGILADAFKNGIENGRDGKGSIYVFATGNGAMSGDNCNFDGYTNSIYTITVGAIDYSDAHPPYSESCSAQLVVTYSSGGGHFIYTTNVGSNVCSDHHGGTSAAAPNAAGVFALVLSVRPDLTWRDLQHLCVQTAIPVSLQDEDWKRLPSGRLYNHKFGYGKLDAYAIIEAAKTFKNVNKQTYLEVPIVMNRTSIPDSTDRKTKIPLRSTVEVTEEMIKAAGLLRLEHITATVNIDHRCRGNVVVNLESPNKVTSELATARGNDRSTSGMNNWKFMSVKHWEENPVGKWSLLVYDVGNPEATGSLLNWTLTLFGEMDPAADEATLIHHPVANHDTKHDHSTSIVIPKPTSSSLSSADTYIPPRPTRVKPKPASTTTTTTATTKHRSTVSVTATQSHSSNRPAADEASITPSGQPISENKSGISSTIAYGLVGSAAILSLAGIMYLGKRKGWRNSAFSIADSPGYRRSPDATADDYEFSFLGDDEDEDEEDERVHSDGQPLLHDKPAHTQHS